MTSDDLVVVLPGIMGSTLLHDGRAVWAPSAGSVVRAVKSFGDSLRSLQLPDGIGDDHPGDGVVAGELMPDLHLLPGIWTPVKGYTPLVERLQRIGFHTTSHGAPGNLVLFPYDWRLSNRYNGKLLASVVEPALERWRAQGGRYREAKVTFVCHSMGGLIARWFITHGGAEITDKLVTLGTPYRGAARAVDQLVHGVNKGFGALSLDLTSFARSLPSLYQLLPAYACVDLGGSLVTLGEIDPLPELSRSRVDDAARFYAELEAAETENASTGDHRHAITGSRQLTATTVDVTGQTVALSNIYDGNDLGGDGTVPAVAGPRGVPLDSNTLRRVADKHGNLQRNAAALDEMESVLLSKPIVPKAGHGAELRVDTPEYVTESQPLVVAIEGEPGTVRVTVKGEGTATPQSHVIRRSGDRAETAFIGLAPGAYDVTVSGVRIGDVQPVASTVVVWPPTL